MDLDATGMLRLWEGRRLTPTRCGWVHDDPLYVAYHDEEWGVPVRDDRMLFEMLTLEGAQAGLNWRTILKKRRGYRRAFDGFDPERVARYGDKQDRITPRRHRHRAQPSQDTCRDRQCARVARPARVGYALLGVPVGVHRRRAGGQRLVPDRRYPGRDTGIRGDEQGAQGPRIPFRRSDHLLRVHAGSGYGERPRYILLSLGGMQGPAARTSGSASRLTRL